ncbi:hypothetical protein AB4251_22250 [Vibrio lentus]|uniref:hypothetical protein n=1 Tax=Vibrio lentus TaxID=136468 RepID=UPI001E4046D3|nr:hypothetical protein [Vibrio lentus]MCC4836646.1 hypothetical protein [Vibrio lentus]
MASSKEGRLPPYFRPIVERHSPKRINFESDVSYDTTKALIWFMLAMCVVTGGWEAGAVIGSL